MEEKTFDTGKVILNYAVGGLENGPALVLLHGGSGRWQLLEPFANHFSEIGRVYALDLRGHGKSGRVAWGYALRDYADDLNCFMSEVSGPALLYGHSLGGIIALLIAGTYPEHVRGVMVGDSPLDRATWGVAMQCQLAMARRWQELSGGRYSVEEIAAALKEAPMGSLGPEEDHPKRMRDIFPDEHPVYQEMAERLYIHDPDVLGMLLDDFDNASRGYEMETLLPAIRCPVLLLQGDPEAGAAMTDEEAVRAVKLLPQPTHVKFAGLSHLMNLEDPEAVIGAMEKFITRVG